MRRLLTLVAVGLALGTVASARTRQQPPSATEAGEARVAPIAVPQGDGAPVITDGIFTPGEWDDALAVAVADGVTMLLKEYRAVVFVGVRGQDGGIGPSELSLAAPGGPIEKLHVSFALGQVAVRGTGDPPKMRLGFTTDWYANELRRDEEEFERLRKEGRDPREVMRATSYPSEGLEFAIRRTKVPGRVWLARLWASAVVAGTPTMVTYPPSAPERTTDGWLELRLR